MEIDEPYVIGIDVGGTNTDAVVMRGRRVVAYSKRATTADVTTGVLDSLHEALKNCPDRRVRLQQINIGTTHFINAVVQRSSQLSKVVALRLAKPPCTDATPPFGDFPESLRRLVDGGWHLLNGGYEVDARELSAVDESEICAAVEQSISVHGYNHFAITGVFSPINPDQEERAKRVIVAKFSGVSVTCSHELGHIGLLERENAAILNECSKDLARSTLRQLRDSIASELGLTCPIYLTQNDGTVCSIEYAMDFPVLTFSSGATNSMRGAAFISGVQNAIVVDIGGTTTDVGVLTDGFPKEANSKIDVGGVPTFFRMPLTYSVALGGGSIVRETDRGVTVGPDSVGYRLTKESICFGGSVLTTTDIAVAFGLAPEINADGRRLADLARSESGQWALALIRSKVETAIDYVKNDKSPVPIVLVGGGAVLIDPNQPMEGCSEIVSTQHSQIANAIGAALCQVSGFADIVTTVDPARPQSRIEALDNAKRKAIDSAIENGAVPESVQIVECTELPLTHLPGIAVQFKIRAIGDLSVDLSNTTTVDLEQLTRRRSPSEMASSPEPTGTLATSPAETDSEWLQRADTIIGDHAPFDDNGEWFLDRYDAECVAIGAGIMGCGGGGNPHAGKLRILHLLRKGLRPRVVTVDRLLADISDPSNFDVFAVAAMGAPVCCSEKLHTDRAMAAAIAFTMDMKSNPHRYEHLPRCQFDGGVTYSDHIPVPREALDRLVSSSSSAADRDFAVMACEVGGSNTMEPLAISASVGVPCMDVDGMGRAYPELQGLSESWMYTPFVYGKSWNPMVQTDDGDRITVSWTADSPKDVENFHRHICIENGCKSNLVFAGVPITKLKDVCVQGSVSRTWRVGKTVLDARKRKQSPVDAVVQDQRGKLIFIGKITDVYRRMEGGFQKGSVTFVELSNPQNEFVVQFQNENLLVKRGDRILATVPDLICILDADTGDPITTDELRYGLRVAVIVLPPSAMLTTERALPVFGPEAFGLGVEYKPFSES